MLSRLHRKAEALDAACLRAWGHPHDPAVRQELLDALKWDSSLNPEHARPVIRDLFKQVHDQSVNLANYMRALADNSDAIALQFHHHAQSLRQHLAKLVEVLAARRVS